MRCFPLLSLLSGLLIVTACQESPSAPPEVNSIVTGATAAWTLKAPMPTARSGHAAGVVQNSAGAPIILVVGGSDGLTALRVLENYNPGTDTWITKTPMPAVRYQTNGIGVVNGKAYLTGGWRLVDDTPIGGTFEYTLATNTWQNRALRCCSGSGATGVIGGKLYVLTGTDGAGGTGFLDRYDPTTDTWTALPEAPHGHFNGGYGVIGGKFYVAGGIVDCCGAFTGALDVFDPVAGTWTTKASMPTPRWQVASAVLGGKLYVFGGSDSLNVILTTVEAYDPVSDTWSTGVPMPVARAGLAAAAVTTATGNRVAYLFGGYGPALKMTRQTFLFDPTAP